MENTTTAFNCLLAQVNPAKNVWSKPAEVTERKMLVHANYMAQHGFTHTTETLAALYAWLQGYSILITGKVGTGKTFFFKALGIKVISIQSFTGERLEDIKREIYDLNNEEIVIDDVGVEGNASFDKNTELLQVIMDIRDRTNKRTHYTTNFDGEATKERYGVRTLDRFIGSCKFFKFTGESRREAHPNADAVKFLSIQK